MAGTRRVRMLHYISGGRADGTKWPDPQHEDPVIEVPDWEARDLILGGNAADAGPGSSGRPEPAPETVAAPEPEDAAEEAAATEPAEVPRPAPADVKQAWIDYAISQGADKDTAAAMTKADLMSRYGGRL